MNFNKKILASAVLMVIAGSAGAALTPAATCRVYNAQEIANNANVIVPDNLSFGAAGLSTGGATCAGAAIAGTAVVGNTDLLLNAVIEVKLPSGLLFKQNPTMFVAVAAGTVGTGVLTLQGTATGTDTATFKVTTAGVAADVNVVLQNVLVTGAGGALATATASDLSYTITVSGSAAANNTTLTRVAFSAVNAFTFGVPSAATTTEAPTIDILTQSGKKYFSTDAVTNLFAELNNDSLSITDDSTRLGHLGTVYALSGATRTAKIVGDLTGISSIYLVDNSTVCSTTVPAGAVTGTIASGAASASFTGLATAVSYHACVIANGTTLLPETPFKVEYTASATGISTLSGSQNLTAQSYNGSTSVSRYINPFSNTTNPSYVRLYNTGSSPADVSGILYTDAGVATPFTAVATLPAKGALLLSPADLNAKFGSFTGKGTVKWFANKSGSILRSQSVVVTTAGNPSNMTSAE